MSEVRIRPYSLNDVEPLHVAIVESKFELSPWMTWIHDDYSSDETRNWVHGRQGAWERNTEWCFLIVDDEDRILGSCSIHHLDFSNKLGQVGYWVRSSAVNHGVATRATRLLAQWAFRETELHRLEILVSVKNLASRRVAEKAGAIQEGVLGKRLSLNDGSHDAVLFSILNGNSR